MDLMILGGTGQLGRSLAAEAKALGLDFAAFGSELPVQSQACFDEIERARPSKVVNCAALHDISRCEKEPGLAFMVNGYGGSLPSVACARVGAHYVYVSTDYVFSGAAKPGAGGFFEDSAPSPDTWYGRTKLLGEELCLKSEKLGAKVSVARVSNLFGVGGANGKGGKNVIDQMINKAEAGEDLLYYGNSLICPTYARHAARMILSTVTGGVLHAVSSGCCTPAELARFVVSAAGLRARVFETTVPEGALGPRSALVSSYLAPHWRRGVLEYLEERKKARTS